MRLLITIAAGLSFIQIADASGTGAIPLVNPLVAARSSVGSTQAINLVSRGALLSAAVENSCLSWIAVKAPGVETLPLVLRERELPGNLCLVQITSPLDGRQLINRVTLFFEESVTAFHVEDGEWQEASAVRFSVASEVEGRATTAAGASFSHLGLFVFDTTGAFDAGLELPAPEFGAFDQRIRVARGSWHLIWSVIALVVFVILSREVHRRASHTQ